MTTTLDARERVKRQWTQAADAWDRRFAWYSSAFAPVMEWCCTATRLAPGMQVLDIACGAGQPSFLAAEKVGPTGRVVGVDFSPRMIEHATRRARAAALKHLEFREMDAESLCFPDAGFDAVTCTCGVMFFPNADRALAEMYRVLAPGGRLAIAVWDDPSKSSFLLAGGGAVARFFPPGPPDPHAPGGFRFSPPGALHALVTGAGFTEVRVDSLPMPIDVESSDEYWQLFTEMAAGIREKIDTLSDADRARLRAAVDEALAPHRAAGRISLWATPLCATGRKDDQG
jgi:SAM-dependent methyltransferase